jgi:hypothetical protein
MADIQIIKNKLKKLLALAASPNEAEAALAMEKCRELMEKYEIRSIDIDEETNKLNVSTILVKGYTKRHRNWESKLGAAIAETFDAVALWVQDEHEWKMIFIAAKTDAEFVVYLYRTLRRSISKMSKEFAANTPGNKKSLKHNYCLGMAATVYERLLKVYKAIPDTKALVPVKKEAIDEELSKFNIRESSNARISDNAAFMQGVEDGKRLPIHRPLRNTGRSQMLN